MKKKFIEAFLPSKKVTEKSLQSNNYFTHEI